MHDISMLLQDGVKVTICATPEGSRCKGEIIDMLGMALGDFLIIANSSYVDQVRTVLSSAVIYVLSITACSDVRLFLYSLLSLPTLCHYGAFLLEIYFQAHAVLPAI